MGKLEIIDIINIQKNNFAALSVGNARKRPIPSLLPCKMNFLKIYIKNSKPEMQARFGVNKVGNFGSCVREWNRRLNLRSAKGFCPRWNMSKGREISDIPCVLIPKDRLGFENRAGLTLAKGLLEFSSSLTLLFDEENETKRRQS